MLSTNFDALSTFMARRRPTFIWVSSKGESVPGRAIAARQRTASDPYVDRISVGTIALPLDLPIFLRSGSTTKPEIVARDHGTQSNSKWLRTTRLNSHVRMMSWACGATSMGNVSANSSGSVSQRHAIWGLSDEVAQVSMMSVSGTKPPGTPRWSSA